MNLDSHDKNLWIILRKDGYSDRLIRVNLLHDSERSEMLARSVSQGRRLTAKELKKKAEKKTTEEIVEDYKKRLEATPELTGHADLPYKPRIVD